MARPLKEGLDYFPLDVDISADERVEFIEARYGLEGFAVIIKLLTAIYRNGYYIKWDEMQIYVTSRRVSYPVNHLTDVVNDLVNYDFFNKNLYEKYKILTSHGIQTRYLQACEKRKSILMVKEFCLITDDDNFKECRFSYQKPPFLVKGVNNSQADIVKGVNNSQADIVKGVKSTQSKVKESNLVVVVKGDDGEKDFSEVATLFSNNIHPITGEIEMQQLSDSLDHYGKEWTLAAIEEAAKQHGQSVKYVSSILTNWERNGFKAEKPKGGRQYGRNRGNDSRNRSKKERDDKYADFEEADRRQIHPWDLPADGDGAGAEPGKDT